jgi:hypothetical protein
MAKLNLHSQTDSLYEIVLSTFRLIQNGAQLSTLNAATIWPSKFHSLESYINNDRTKKLFPVVNQAWV